MERKRELKRLKAFLFGTWSCVSERKTLYAEVHVQKKKGEKKQKKKHRVDLTAGFQFITLEFNEARKHNVSRKDKKWNSVCSHLVFKPGD